MEKDEVDVTLEIECESNCDMFQITIDGQQYYCTDGNIKKELRKGKSYIIELTVMGEKGCEYSIKIISPPNAGLDINRELDSSKKDTGRFWLEL